MPLNSDEVNYLIYRYLVESGFDHSAFVFLSETALHDRCIGGGQNVERGALIKFLHKGLQYQNFEYHIKKHGSNKRCSAPFHLLKKHICSKSILNEGENDVVDQSRYPIKKQKSHILQKKVLHNRIATITENNGYLEKQNNNIFSPLKSPIIDDTPSSLPLAYGSSSASSSFPNYQQNKDLGPFTVLPNYNDSKLPPKLSYVTAKFSDAVATTIPDTLVTIIKDTQILSSSSDSRPKILQCSWNPTDPLTIALGKEATVCIWKVSMDPTAFEPQLHVNLRHEATDGEGSLLEVNSLQWAPNGALIATGTSEGSTWLWSRSGVKIFHAKKHLGPVLNMEWNTRGNIVATASIDRKIILWDPTTFSATQQIEVYETPIISLGWLNDQTFAVSSLNPAVYVFKTGKNYPLFRFLHTADVNKVSWDPNSNTLVSCSDDSTLKFWHLSNNDPCIWTATGHEGKVNTCQWCPSRDLNIVASAASDGTVRVWDTLKKKPLYVLEHPYPDVSCLDFSPDGKFLATCTEDGVTCIWSVDSGQLVRTFDAKIQVFDAKWNGTGKKLALTLGNSTVAVIDFTP